VPCEPCASATRPSNFFKIFPSHPVTFSPTHRPHNFFRCNTYVFPRKCCKQKTYGRTKFFRCNTYKNRGRVPSFPARLSLQAGTHPFRYPLSPFFHSLAHSPTQRHRRNSFPSQSVTHSFHRDGGCTPGCTPLTASWISPLDANCHTVRPTLFSSLPRYLVTSLLRSLSARFACSCYTVPPWFATPRPTLPCRSHWREEIARAIRVSPHSTVPLPRDDQHCWIEIGSGHGEMTQHLLAAALRPHHRNRSGVPRGPPSPRKAIPQPHRRSRRHSQSRPRCHRFPAAGLRTLRQSALLHHLGDSSSPLHLRRPHRRDTHRHSNGSCSSPRGPTGHARLRLSFRRHQFYTRPEFVFEIPRDAFEPPPEVASALVTLRLPGERAKLAFGSSASSAAGAPADSSLDDASSFPGFCEIVFLAEAQDAGQ